MSWHDGTLTISNGQAESEETDLDAARNPRLKNIMLLCPGTLPETITIKVSDKIGGEYRTLQSDGVDITLGAGKATQLANFLAGSLKLVASPAVGADRIFRILGV